MLERFSKENAKPRTTPLASHFKLSTTQCPKTDDVVHDMSKVPYTSAVGCSMVCTRLDLAEAVRAISKFLLIPRRSHWDAMKWIFKYLRGATNYGIMFNR